MADYKKLYFHLFNHYTDIIEQIKQIQQEAENMYLETSDPDSNHDIIEKDISIK